MKRWILVILVMLGLIMLISVLVRLNSPDPFELDRLKCHDLAWLHGLDYRTRVLNWPCGFYMSCNVLRCEFLIRGEWIDSKTYLQFDENASHEQN
jgi:hypothetical protein